MITKYTLSALDDYLKSHGYGYEYGHADTFSCQLTYRRFPCLVCTDISNAGATGFGYTKEAAKENLLRHIAGKRVSAFLNNGWANDIIPPLIDGE